MLCPISPPSASISRTRCPSANTPIAGLHDMKPMASALIVRRRVEHPIRAAARAASHPACPPPTTMTSYSFGYSYGDPLIAPCSMFHVEHSAYRLYFQLLAYAKRTEDRVEDLFRGHLPQQLREGSRRLPDVRRRELERKPLLHRRLRSGQGRQRPLDRQSLPRPGQRGLGPDRTFRRGHLPGDRRHEIPDPLPCFRGEAQGSPLPRPAESAPLLHHRPVRLVQQDQMRLLRDLFVGRTVPDRSLPAPVQDEEDEIRRRDDLPAAPHPFPLHRVRGLPKPRRVDQGHRDPADGDVGVKIIPRGPRSLHHDRALLPRQAVEQPRFPYVRDTGDHDRRAVPPPSPRLVRPQELFQSFVYFHYPF